MDDYVRLRSYSKDSDPSESSLSGYHTGNRSRANTRTTDDEDCSDSSDVGLLQGFVIDSHKNVRRRSHRPRGCRGGRKNRKKHLAKLGLAEPHEILGVSTTSSTSNNNPLSPKDYNSSFPRILDGNTRMMDGIQSAFPVKNAWGRPNYHQGSLDENNFASSRPRVSGTYTQPQQAPAMTSGLYFDFLHARHSPSSRSHHKSGPNIAFRHVEETVATQVSVKQCDPFLAGTTCASSKGGLCDILPPPPALEPEDDGARKFKGPNPYALGIATVSSSQDDSGDACSSLSVPRSYSDTVTSVSSASNSEEGDSATTHDKQDHHKERIDKQRQMMSDGGGSLFAVSPRTFLMGGRASTKVGMAW